MDDPSAAGMLAAPTIDELLIEDDEGRWAELGFTVAAGCCDLGGVRLRFLPGGTGGTSPGRGLSPGRGTSPGRGLLGDESTRLGLLGWTLRGPACTELDGLPTTASEQPPRAPAPVHPNGVIAIDHVVAFSPALDRSIRALQGAGLDLRRIREQPTPAGAPRQAFFRLGAEILEVVQMSPEAMQGMQDGGQKEPARFWGLAVRVADLDRTVESLGAHVRARRKISQ